MKDAEYLFRQTEIERKRIGRGDYNKKRQGGKQVRFPSDNLTKKERDALNSEVVSYQLGKPTDWATLKSWPEDVQKVYLTGLRKTYGVGSKEIGGMLGVAKVTVCHYEKKLGISAPVGKKINLRLEEWNKFLGRSVERVEEETKAEPKVEPKAEPKVEPLRSKNIDLTLTHPMIPIIKESEEFDLAKLLKSLAGTGAKVTIEIVL